MKKLKNIRFLLVLVFIFPFLSYGMAPSPAPGAPQMAGVPPMSPEELSKWQEEVTKEIDQFVNTLSPEEQAQFHKDVDELTKVMSQMSEEELVEFIGGMFPEEGAAPVPGAPMPAEEPIVCPLPAPAPEKFQPTAPAKSIEAAQKLIDDIIAHAEHFMRKAQIIPELPGKIEQWVEKNKIKEWNADISWEILKNKIELFIQQLHTLKELDPVSKTHRHLSDLVQNERLYNNLAHIRDTLVRYEAAVEAPAFGLGKVTSQSRAAIRSVLSKFVEAFYKMDVLEDIKKLLEKYEPRAKILREEEETSRKKAVEESKKERVGAPKRETKMPETGKRSTDYTGNDYGYPSYGYNPYYEPGYDQYYAPEQRGGYGAPSGNQAKPGEKGPGGAKGGTPGKTSGGAEAGQKPGGKDEAVKKKDETPLDAGSIRKLDKLEKLMQETAQALNQGQLPKISDHMFDKSPVDIETAINYLPAAKKKLKNLLDQIKSFKLNKEQKALAGEIKAIFKDNKAAFENINAQVQKIMAKLNDASADKQYAYFAREKDRASKDIVGQIQSPESLEAVMLLIQQIAKEIGVTLEAKTMKLPEEPKAPSMKEAANKKGATEESMVSEQQKKGKQQKEEKAKAAGQGQQPAAKRAAARVAPAQPAAPLEGFVLDRALRKIDQQLDTIDTQLTNLQDIQKHIADINQQASQAHATRITQVTEGVQKLTQDIQDVLQRIPDAQRKVIRAELHDVYVGHQPIFDEAIRQIQAIQALPVISPDKQIAYFGGQLTPAQEAALIDANQREAIRIIREDIPQPASLLDLAHALQALAKLLA